jgi:ribose 5-phosphate isomerase B
MRKILIASDHAGYELKQQLIERSALLDLQFEDLGTNSTASVDYPDYANALCKQLIADELKSHSNTPPLGVLICGSGVGVSIAANRHKEIRAVLAESAKVAVASREHNHANVLCMGSRVVSIDTAMEILKAYLDAVPNLEERHVNRIKKLSC